MGYTSPDGLTWTLICGPAPILTSSTTYVGLAVDSGNISYSSTATFDNVSISAASGSNAPWISHLSATTGAVGSGVTISGSSFGSTQGASVVYLNDSPVTVTSWSDTSISITIPSGASSGLIVVLVGSSMNSSNGVTFTVTNSALPGGWLDQDIGAVIKAGNATYSSGAFTVQGAGLGIAGSADAFHFVYQPLASDGTIVARIVSQDTYSQAAVMIRETLDSASAETASFSYSEGSNDSSRMDFRSVP